MPAYKGRLQDAALRLTLIKNFFYCNIIITFPV